MIIFKNTIVQTVLIFVISLGIIVGVFLGTKGASSKNEKKRTLKEFELFFSEVSNYEKVELVGDSKSVVSAYKIFDKENEEVGMVLEAKTTNMFTSNGFIHLKVGVNNDKLITNILVVEMDQSRDVANTYKNIEKYLNLTIGEQKSINDANIISGATYSLTSINELMTDIKEAFDLYSTAKSDPLEDLFGKGFERVIDNLFVVEGSIKQKENVVLNETVVGEIFTLTKEGVFEKNYGGNYDPNDDTKTFYTGKITVVVVLKDGIIKQITIDENSYGHTPGYMPDALGFLQRWVGKDIAEYPNLDDASLETGSTYSTHLVDSMLKELRGYKGGDN